MSKKPSLFDNVETPKNASKDLPQDSLTFKDSAKKEKGLLYLKNLKYLPRFFSKREKWVLFFLVALVILTSVFLGVENAGYNVQVIPTEGGRYVEGVVGEPQHINPLLSQASDTDQDISSLIFSGLLKYNENQELVPDLAESYEISEDQKNYTFHLRKDVVWHDGEKFTADDVVFTVQTIKSPEINSPLLSSLSGVAVEKIDDYTVKLTLTGDTYSPFFKESTIFGILPKHIWENISPSSVALSEANLKPVGTGPFKFKDYKKDKKAGAILSYNLERNSDYYGNKPLIEYFTFNIYMDWDTAIEAYKKGDVLGVGYIPRDSKLLITEKLEKKINYYHLKLPQYFALFFNWDDNPLLKERNVRRAIAYSIDRDRIINEALDGEAVPVYAAIMPNFLGHNEGIEKYAINPQKAKEELEKGLWKFNQEENAYYKDNQKLEFTLFVSGQESYLKTAEIIQEDLAKIGITCHIEPIDPITLKTENVKPRSYEVLLYGQLLMHDPDPYPFWHSSERKDPGLNLSNYRNASVDDLLETARKTTNKEDRINKYIHFQNIMAEELPAIFLYSPTYLYSVDKKVNGIELEYITLPHDRFASISKWYLETKPILVKEEDK
ncbi:hypothetical protein KKC60_01220 [Patescibacteria group bacterium]|nr:hypothetical protein [Patescibacteria group bacterium]